MRAPRFLTAAFSLLLVPVAFAQNPSLTIHVNQPTAKVSPMLYGLMTEEINFSYDGGLYGELIRDRAVGSGRRPLFHWTQVVHGNSAVDISVDDHTGPSEALARSYKVSVSTANDSAPAGMQNDGYWGIPVRANTSYGGSFYAKTDDDGVPVTVSLINDQTGATAASADGRRHHRRMEAVHLHTEDRAGGGVGQQSFPAHGCKAGDESGSISFRSFRPPITIAQTAIASTSWISWPPCITRFLRLPGRKLSRGRSHRGALRLEEDDWSAGGSAHAS